MKTIERLLIDKLKTLMPTARFERKKDKTGGTFHVTIKDIAKTEVDSVLTEQGFTCKNSDRNHSSRYTGEYIIFDNEKVYIVVRTAKARKGGHYIIQKQTAPEKLFLKLKYTNANAMKDDIINGLDKANIPNNVSDALISLLDVADGTDVLFRNKEILNTDKSFTTSDFGEVLGAYNHLVNGAKCIEFPSASNNLNIDYVVDGVGIAHKSVNGSSRFTLDSSVASSLLALTRDCNHLKVLQSIVSRDKFGILSNASVNCPELKYWNDMLNGFSIESLQNYVDTHTFDQYIDDVYKSQTGKLGISTKQDQVRTAWKNGSIEPMLFTLLTFMARYYSENYVDKLGKIVKSVIGDNIFEYVDYDTDTNEIKVAQKPYQLYNKWKIHYHGNSINAFNNWPAPVGIEE